MPPRTRPRAGPSARDIDPRGAMDAPGDAPRNDAPPPGVAREPGALSEAERAADRRSLVVIVAWLGGCAFLGALYLVLAIWLDWV